MSKYNMNRDTNWTKQVGTYVLKVNVNNHRFVYAKMEKNRDWLDCQLEDEKIDC